MEEIEYLKSNLQSDKRGEAIVQIKNRIDSIIEEINWNGAYEFFMTYQEAFNNNPKVLNIISDKFAELIEKGVQAGNGFKNIIGIHHLERFY